MTTELRKEAEMLSQLAQGIAEDRIKGIRKALQRDMECGKGDAKAGIYDKWYRENRADAGLAYDAGWKLGRCEMVEQGIELGAVQFIG